MTETELLNYALHTIRKTRSLIGEAYNVHDHESDLGGGIALSAARLSAEALEQELTSIIIQSGGNSEA